MGKETLNAYASEVVAMTTSLPEFDVGGRTETLNALRECVGATNDVACAGVARDHDGAFVDGFMFKIGRGNSLHAELWAVLWGLKRSWELIWKRLIIETDCMEVIDLVVSGWPDYHPDWHLLEEIKWWMDREWDVRLDWCSRDVNLAADTLAKKPLLSAKGINFFCTPPRCIQSLVGTDAIV
ncbi:uncharacterized protein LOC114732739 [Neltuma alba]|uniref:uncharacterized protein LOC114732739 n=1 Tax=Neltuma alba TaxID=207710 RepID=UPI0010A35FCD|nr:uncharacterized protein LOC114732739 [Prosopis alba]